MRQSTPQAGHSSSATWLADLSPITSRSPPPPAPILRGQQQPTWHTRPRAYYGSDAGSFHEPPRWNFTVPARNGGLSPHLVRSRSPPSPAAPPRTSVQPRATGTAQAPRPAHSGFTNRAAEPSAPADLLAEVRAEWTFTPHPTDGPVLQGAVAAGQRAAAVHRANDAFFDAFTDLAREAAGRVVEVDRHRLAAQQSAAKWRAAQEAHTRACKELQDAQARLARLEAAQVQQRATAAAAESVDAAPLLPADASMDVVALQLDAEMTAMRTLKEQYATLCTRKTRLEAQVEELERAGRDLALRLDAARQQRAQQLQEGVAPSSQPAAAARPSAEVLAGALEDLSVCLMERRGLLRHLRDGASDRLKRLRALTTASQVHGDATASTSPPTPPPSALLDEVAQAHAALCEGEEEALREMEQLLLLLQRRASRGSANAQLSRSPSVPTPGTPPVMVTPDRVGTEEST